MDNLLVGEHHPARGLSEGPSTTRVQSEGGGHHNPSCEIEIDEDQNAVRAVGTNTNDVSSRKNVSVMHSLLEGRCLCICVRGRLSTISHAFRGCLATVLRLPMTNVTTNRCRHGSSRSRSTSPQVTTSIHRTQKSRLWVTTIRQVHIQ